MVADVNAYFEKGKAGEAAPAEETPAAE